MKGPSLGGQNAPLLLRPSVTGFGDRLIRKCRRHLEANPIITVYLLIKSVQLYLNLSNIFFST